MSEKQQTPLYRTIFDSARYYHEGATFMKANVFGGTENPNLIAPILLCANFSIELLLKCLRIIQFDDVYTKSDLDSKNIRLNGHIYSRIFEGVDAEVKNLVAQTYNELYNESISPQDFVALLQKLGDNNFVEWRYVFEESENRNIDMQLQQRITDSLGKAVEKLLHLKKGGTSHGA